MKSMLIMVFCVAVCITGQTQAANPAEEDSIRETVFRYQFDHNGAGQQKKAMVYCLSLGDLDKKIDPSDAFIDRFRHHSPPIRKSSECKIDALGGVRDARIGMRGLLFYVAEIRWLSSAKVEVSGGYYQDGLSASGNIYTVIHRNGSWTVTHEKLKWISMLPSLFSYIHA
jgi:hypothetical protein